MKFKSGLYRTLERNSTSQGDPMGHYNDWIWKAKPPLKPGSGQRPLQMPWARQEKTEKRQLRKAGT